MSEKRADKRGATEKRQTEKGEENRWECENVSNK